MPDMEFDSLREELISDPLNTYRLLNYLVDHKYYQTAVFASRQVLGPGWSQPGTNLDKCSQVL